MSTSVALFLSIGAAAVALFACLSIAVWVTTPSTEPKARERLAVLRAVAENPNENAAEVPAYLREEDRLREAKKLREERRGGLMGGAVLVAEGTGPCVIMAVLARGGGVWSVGLIPLLIGVVLLGFGAFAREHSVDGAVLGGSLGREREAGLDRR